MVRENEQFEADETGVANLLSALPRVDAPGDFEFGVRRRIAAGRPSRALSGYRWVAALAAPVLVFAVVSGIYLYRPNIDQSNVAGTGTVHTTTPVVDQPMASAPDSPTVGPEIAQNPQLPIVNPLIENRPTSRGPSPEIDISRNGSSETDAATRPKQIYPKGMDPNSRVNVKARDFQTPKSFSAKDVLDQMGVGLGASESELTVDVVRENSMAAKAGIKPGDVIQLINRQRVTTKTAYKGQFAGKSVTVKRDGATVELELKP